MNEIHTDQGLIKGDIWFPGCKCGAVKVWLQVWMNGRVIHESTACPVCDKYRLGVMEARAIGEKRSV